jgi:hypothetical protein
MAEKGNLKQDDLIAKLVKDPKAPPDALLLTGFLGASSEDDHTRLYLTATLDDYVEIPTDAILHTQEIPKDQSPLGGTLLWIKKDAELIHGKVGPNRTKARFLEGRIQQEFIRAQAAGPAGVPGTATVPLVTLPGHTCPPLGGGGGVSVVPLLCPTRQIVCTHFGPACQTHQVFCTLVGPNCSTLQFQCATVAAGCLTQVHCTLSGPLCVTHHPPICGVQTLPGAGCPINTIAPPCPVGSGPFCGGVGGSAACQPGGPVQVDPVQAAAHFAAAQAFQQPSVGCLTVPACSANAPNCPTTDFACTVVGLNCPSQQGICTAVDPNCNQLTQQFPCAQTLGCPPTQNLACPTHHLGCTVDLRTCINTVNPQQCQVLSANCPTPACPTLHPVVCTVAGPACGVTGPQCLVVSAFCPTPACPTQNQLACRPSIVLAQCPTLQLVHCPVPSVQRLHCGPSIVEICPSLRLDCLPSQGIHLCPSRPAILCGVASGGFGCIPQGPGPQGPGPFAGGIQPQLLQILQTLPNICPQPHTLMACPTQDIIACHPTLLCPSQAACPTAFAFCPSLACGFGGFNQF